MLKLRHLSFISLMTLIWLAACSGNAGQQSMSATATLTLAPIVSMTPRFTATPVPTRTAIPTDTLTPSDTPIPPTPSDTFTPSPTPPIVGVIASINTVNVREGPGVNFSAFIALPPGTRVEVLGQNADGNWINVQLEDGREGWVANTLLRLQETPTSAPTATPSPDLTALAQGTTLPTAILGGGTITPTPPRSIVSPTVITTVQVQNTVQSGSGGTPTSFLPVIDVASINQTATALAGGIVAPTSSPTGQAGSTTIPTTVPNVTLASGGTAGQASAQQGVDVLAYCNDASYGTPAPTNLASGSTIDIWWSWFAQTEQQVRDHIANAVYEVAIDGIALENVNTYRGSIRQQGDGNYYVYWYIPAGPLDAGAHEITYSVSWRQPITDGYAQFGPGTSNLSETGNCTFNVR